MVTTSNSYEYIKRVNDVYDSEQSITDMLSSFRLISEEYNKLSSTIPPFAYTSYSFNELSKEEKESFYNDQLQFIECLVTNSIYDKVGTVRDWGYIIKLLRDAEYAKVEKVKRRVVYATNSNNRPIGDIAYQLWNGLQIIDLDIKDAELCDKIKPIIFNELKRFNWFLGVCKSASGKGLHIWTKITPISIEAKNRKIEYLCNFRHKYSYVYVVLNTHASEIGYSKDNIFEFLDMAMCRPQQGIFISSDSDALVNSNFKDLRLDVNFEGAFECGLSSVNWIMHPDLKNVFSKLDWFNNDNFDKESNIEIQNIGNLSERDESAAKGPKHYKHAQRWQLANTLTNLFGETEALQIMCSICKNTETKELRGDVKTAAVHNKPISIWAVKELNTQHGFNIEIKNGDVITNNLKELNEKLKEKEVYEDPIKVLNDNTEQVVLHITKNQYLSDIKDDIIKNLSHITLLEAGAGYGKTEMIKSLKSKTLLILPFTSTIKAKVEASNVTKDWLYYYGNKRPQIQDLMSDKNMSMTIDKFSRLNIFELDAANFEYIVIDESHLLFTSSYRDVMGPCIQRLANCKAKVIMMTGTPTGELLFFPNIKHIRVKKEDTRIKQCTFHFTPTNTEQLVEMCKSMANDIVEGTKVLFPTNNGVTYYEQVIGIVQEFLTKKKFPRALKSFYYKKSNYGEEDMEDINRRSTIGDNDLICCSTYLSVGVDICDKGKFSVYFDRLWIPQDIEQFANRIRNNNLYIHIFLPYLVNGIPINYNNTDPLDLGFDRKDLLLARDIIKTCNDMIERNQEESKYSPFIISLLSQNRYLKYDENDCRYYIDETTYKLKVFEDRYAVYAKQYNVVAEGLRYYGYEIDIKNDYKQVSESNKDWVDDLLKACKHARFNYVTTQTMILLSNINDSNIDIYRELTKGNLEIFKDEKYKEDRIENKIYAESIEILEKNIPIVLSLYKYYDCDTIRDIYDYCVEQKTNKINFTKLTRIKTFANIQANIKKKRMDFPVLKFVTDCRDWTLANPTTTKQEIELFLANWAAKYCNSIKDVVVEDIEYLETIYELLKELWRVIIVQSHPKKGGITISPFEMLWETKQELNNIYGDLKTQTFFLEQLLGEEPIETEKKEDEEKLEDLPHTHKMKLEDIEDELANFIDLNYDFNKYRNHNDANDKFLRKQENTNKLGELFIKTNNDNGLSADNSSKQELDLFSSANVNPDDLPF